MANEQTNEQIIQLESTDSETSRLVINEPIEPIEIIQPTHTNQQRCWLLEYIKNMTDDQVIRTSQILHLAIVVIFMFVYMLVILYVIQPIDDNCKYAKQYCQDLIKNTIQSEYQLFDTNDWCDNFGENGLTKSKNDYCKKSGVIINIFMYLSLSFFLLPRGLPKIIRYCRDRLQN